MNKKLKVSLFTTLILLCGITVFNSCKKNKEAEIIPESKDLVEFYKQKLKDEPTRITQELNLAGKGYYSDLNGNRITSINLGVGRSTSSTCPNPTESEYDQVLLSATRDFFCGVGYTYEIKYKITSEFTPLLTTGPSTYSFGRIRLKNSSGTVIYTTSFANRNPMLSIVNNGIVGQNSNGDDLTEYVLTYRTEQISSTIFNTATSMESMFSAYTDCPNYAIIQVPFSSSQAVSTTAQNSLPCSRVDKVYFNPRNGSTPPSVAGVNVTGSSCFPYGYVFPAKQSIEFRVGNTTTWKPFSLFTIGASGTSSPIQFINYWEAKYIDVTSSQTLNGLIPGNVQVRYRNDNTSASPSCTSASYVFETWLVN